MNERIRISPVRVIDEGGEQLGILPTAEALERARQVGLDLVEVSPTERPPVCKIMDYGKFKYNQKKKQRQQHKHSHETQIKEVRFRPKIDKNDREVKMKRARGFLEKGDKVQFTMLFRGRENAHRDIGRDIFSEIVEEFSEISKMEQFPKLAGRRMTMVLAPTKIKPPTAEKPKAAVKPKEASIPKEAAKPEEAAKPAEVSKPD